MVKLRKYTLENTFLTQRGYAILKDENKECTEYLKQLLTVCPKINPSMMTDVKEFCVYRENTTKLYIPKCLGFEIFGSPKVNTLHSGIDCPNLIFNGTLRPEQQEPIQAFLNSPNTSGIISVGCGGGKTAMGLYLATVFKKKTLVVCHKEFLINQWKERIEQFVPTARVGLIKGKTLDYKDKDIVLATIQSLATKDYDSAIFAEFGNTTFDECHHVSAEVFSKALPKLTSQVTLGLSATLDRKDGLRCVFEWYLGKPVFQNKKRDDTQLIVELLKIPNNDPCPEYGQEIKMWNGKQNFAAMINALCAFEDRTELLLNALTKLLTKDTERCVLILSERRQHLKYIESELKKKGYSIGYYVGGMNETQLKLSESKQIILGTYSMASEGMDIPVLNTLVLASPIASIEQSIGRIQRQKQKDRKYIPYVIDVCDNYSLFSNQVRKRIAFYKKNKYEILNDKDNDDNEDDEKKSTKLQFIDSDED